MTDESPRPRTLMSWSTGKDSAWALHMLRARNEVDVVGLFTTTIGEDTQGRVAIHGIRLATLEAQAAAVGLPVFQVHLPDPCPNDAYEKAMEGFIARVRETGITHMAFGDLFLEDVRRYREDKLAGTGITPLFPLWGLETHALAREMIAAGVKARIVSVDLEHIGAEFAGREYDAALLGDLPKGCDLCGENGEFHTFSYDGPAFARPVAIEMGETRRTERFVHIEPLAITTTSIRILPQID